MKTKKNIDFKWNGIFFLKIPIVTYTQKINGTTIENHYATMGGVSKVARQYIKQKHGVCVQVSTESYSGGDSLTIYVNPTAVTREVYDSLKSNIKSLFQYGSFDGMTDMYNYKDGFTGITDPETGVTFDTKYCFVQYGAKYGTKLWKEIQNNKTYKPIT